MTDLNFLTATELAKIIREREASAVEVLEAHLSNITEHNPSINAIVTLDEQRARRRAEEADEALQHGDVWGPLHGVPVTIKDAFETEGLRTTCSFKPLSDYVPTQDATVVARIRSAGAIVVGKTNVPMMLADWQTNSPIFGRANNPWDQGRTTGGSTGGGAAAVAAGFSALEIGSDMGGSIRIPAHSCGVFGMKPTERRIPGTGHIPEPPGVPRFVRHMASIGTLARSVEDLKLSLSILEGPDKGDFEVPPPPVETQSEKSLSEYSFVLTDDFGGVPICPDTRRAMEALANDLSKAGCKVERRSPHPFDFDAAWETWGEMFGAEAGASMSPPMLFLWRMQMKLTMGKTTPISRGFMRGTKLNVRRYARALTRRDGFIKTMEQFLSESDALLCPVAPGPAFTHRKTGKPIEVDGQKLSYTMGAAAYATLFNLTGNPVVVLPLTRSKEGLPIGIQVVGRRWCDMELLDIASRLSEVTGVFQRPPGF